jgi:hypothetical protein
MRSAKKAVNGSGPPGDEGQDYKLVRKRVNSLHPSPENLQLYRAVQDDPDIGKLAEAIKRNGCDPLIVTLDNFIVSGHRRRAALLEIGQQFVPCHVLPIRRDALSTDEYIALLRSYNHQRNKTVAEQVREELVDINPDAAYQALCERRDKVFARAEESGVKVLKIEGVKRRHGISDAKAEHVHYIKQIVFEDRKEYWPLSIRAVHYALLNYQFLRNTRQRLPYKNDDKSYTATSDLITRMRLNDSIPWEAFDDVTRPIKQFHPFDDVRVFIRQEVDGLFEGYWRDLLQSQENYVEVVCEKNTIYHMVLQVTRKYQIPTSSGRGFNSIDPWHDLAVRYMHSGKQGRLVVIVLADYDPEGEMIPQVGGRTLRDDFGVRNFDIIKAGVTRDQIEKYPIPPQNFAKETSSNYDWFVERNGGDDTVYELESLNPKDMLRDLETAIQSVIDVDLFNREVATEKNEAVYVEAARKRALKALKGVEDVMDGDGNDEGEP